MSTFSMKRQIDRLASDIGQIKPKPLIQSKLMTVPPADASDEAKAAYQEEFNQAQAAGVMIIQLVPGTKKAKPCQAKRSADKSNASRQLSK
jgi:hypothetical protein